MMATPVTLSTSREADGQIVVTAAGEIDMSNLDGFERALGDAAAQANGTPVRVDLTAVDYLDSGAINVLFAHADRVRLVANTFLMPVLRISGITELTGVELGG